MRSPAPAEPMTEDTIFDIASLTKPLATATAVMQLYEQGKVRFDDPVQQYLPDFNAGNDPQRAEVTVRMLLTHTSGEPGDVNLGDPWGLEEPDRAEGFHRALTTPLVSGRVVGFATPTSTSFCSAGWWRSSPARQKMIMCSRTSLGRWGCTTPAFCRRRKHVARTRSEGRRSLGLPRPVPAECPSGTWDIGLLPRIAPTARDEENRGDPSKNPDLDYLLRGTVKDTTARRMGGVAGHAGVFSTARDVGVFAQSLLDRLAGRPSEFPLKQETWR